MVDQISMSKAEFNSALEQAATKAIISRLEKSHFEHLKLHNDTLTEMNGRLITLNDSINKWPERLNACKDQVKHEMDLEMKDFMTHKDGTLMEQRIQGKINEINGKIKTTTIVIVSIAGIIQFALTTIVLISKLTELLSIAPHP